jgi:hypothetical protein
MAFVLFVVETAVVSPQLENQCESVESVSKKNPDTFRRVGNLPLVSTHYAYRSR